MKIIHKAIMPAVPCQILQKAVIIDHIFEKNSQSVPTFIIKMNLRVIVFFRIPVSKMAHNFMR